MDPYYSIDISSNSLFILWSDEVIWVCQRGSQQYDFLAFLWIRICLYTYHNFPQSLLFLLSAFHASFPLLILPIFLPFSIALLASSLFHLHFILSICTKVTKQGMEMAAEGALLVSSNLGSCAIDPTFTAQVEQRVVKEVCTCCFDILWQYTLHLRWILIKIPWDVLNWVHCVCLEIILLF